MLLHTDAVRVKLANSKPLEECLLPTECLIGFSCSLYSPQEPASPGMHGTPRSSGNIC